MKTWWVQTGHPWLKDNWWAVVISPLILLTAVSMLAYRRVFSEPVAVDHLRGTDALARAEAESRAQRFQEEKERLEAELTDIRQKYTDLQTQFESRLDARVQELRDNPEKLRQLMLAVGRGQ